MKIIAHRGASYESPENTLASFKRAHNVGAHFIECDVQITQDLVPVIFHDTTLMRICNKRKRITDLPIDELQELDAGEWFHSKYAGEKIPLLEDALALDIPCIFMLEIKATAPPKKLAKAVVKVVKRSKKRVLIGSFCPHVLREVKAIAPNIHLVGIADTISGLKRHRNLGINHFALDYRLITKELMDELLEDEACVWVWTVDHSLRGKRLLKMGVHGLITNHPRRFIASRKRAKVGR